MFFRRVFIGALVGVLLSAQTPGSFPPGVFLSRGALDAGSGSTPFAITYATPAQSTTSIPAGVATFTSQNIGTADSTRIVVIAIYLKGSGSATAAVTAVALSVGATCTATQATSAAQGNTHASTDLWYCAAATGTSATVAVTTTNSPQRVTIATYSVTGTGAAINPSSCCGGSNSSAGSSTVTATLTPPAGGGTIGIGLANGSATTASGTNLTLDLNDNSSFGTNTYAAGHNTSASGSTTYTITWGTSPQNAGSFATFSP